MVSCAPGDVEGWVSPVLCDSLAGGKRVAPGRRPLVALCAAAGFLAYIDRVNISVAIVEMGQDLHWDLQQRGLVLASFFYGYILSQVCGAVRGGGPATVLLGFW